LTIDLLNWCNIFSWCQSFIVASTISWCFANCKR